MFKKPTVSVIIPTYNRAHLISRAIKSVLTQTYQNFEIIVVDDGSKDNTEEVVKSFRDKRIRYIRHKKNKGAPAARNTGIRTAKGKYVALQESDDEWLSKKLEEQMKAFECAPPNVGVVYSGVWLISKEKRKLLMPHKEGNIHKDILRGCYIGTPTVVVKKECFSKAGMFDEKLPCKQERELWIRISKYYHFKYIDEPLVIAHWCPDGITANREKQPQGLKLLLKKHFKEINQDKTLLAQYYQGIGILLYLDGKINQGRSYLMKAIKTYPLHANFSLTAFLLLFNQRTYSIVRKFKRKLQSWKL